MARACVCGRINCTTHKRHAHKPKGAWGGEHQRRRDAMLRAMAQGTIPAVCARCGEGPRDTDPWEAGHVEAVALGGGAQVRPEHRSCNRRHGAQLGAALKKQQIEQRWARIHEETMKVIVG